MSTKDRIRELNSNLRPNVPLPPDLDTDSIVKAMAHTEKIFEDFYDQTGVKLASILQANTLSGIVSNLFTVRLADASKYVPNPDEKAYPDLVWGGKGKHTGIEIKATVDCNKGAEAHNGHGGWHMVAAFKTTDTGGIRFFQLLAADLVAYGDPDSDWSYQGSGSGSGGSQRTETYITNSKGTSKLRDGMVLVDEIAREKKIRNLFGSRRKVESQFGLTIPSYSPFYMFVKLP